MPSYLDFNSTKVFRDSILARTLQQPNGPQTFNSGAYSVENLRDQANVDPGDVETNLQTYLAVPENLNTFGADAFTTVSDLRNLVRLDDLGLYPYYTAGNYNNLISIMTTNDYESESKLMQFAAFNIKSNKQGPVLARITQNLVAATYGRVRLIDALEGNTATAVNLITGREDLIEKNYKITVAKTLAGKAIDFLQTVAGVEFPWSEIPGDYLTNPRNPIVNRPEAQTQAGAIIQDITGALGSLLGIQRRPKPSRKPSDLMIEYMGGGQKAVLFDNLRFSTYAPNYTKTARSQQSSKLFNFPNQIGDAINDVLGTGAPAGVAYIGDDRGEDVNYAMNDFNENVIRSSYYLSLLFDPVQTELFEFKRNISEGGQISGKLTWYSKNSKNKLGVNNAEFNSERSQFEESLSNSYSFRSDSILDKTQQLLDSMPSDGGAARGHVGNAIDQTSRIFREGNTLMSRGSAIKYVDKFSGDEGGVEYCRVWTKDRSYMNMSDTMKRTGNIRKFDSSVMSTPWNLNIAPMSNGQNGDPDTAFASSTNIVKAGDSYVAKKYMFSIENLAWKTSNMPGFMVSDLPYCERGPNGGRVMWFPPYDLKVNEQNSARWEENSFLGRPEPIYTYQNTSRSGQIQFKIVVDHPSILNLLVQKHFKGMSNEESDNYINAFFAGCEELDFYELIRTYTTLTKDDADNIKKYLEDGGTPEEILKYKVISEDAEIVEFDPQEVEGKKEKFEVNLYFPNDYPQKSGSKDVNTQVPYSDIKTSYSQSEYEGYLDSGLTTLFSGSNTAAKKNDKNVVFGSETVTGTPDEINHVKSKLTDAFVKLDTNFGNYTSKLTEIQKKIENKELEYVAVGLQSSTSSVADDQYNVYLSMRRAHSVVQDIIKQIEKPGNNTTVKWPTSVSSGNGSKPFGPILYKFSELGYEGLEGEFVINGESFGENVDDATLGGLNQSIMNSGGSQNIDCHNKNIMSSSALKKSAPITFYCRYTGVVIETKEKNTLTEPPNDPDQVPKFKLEPDGTVKQPAVKKPPIDMMKKIIMKTLSECYYFKVLEEDSPNTFKSLTEKLKYFHPAFHSTTPEGLNSRLNFLLQCVRPGDTIPVKGLASDLDVRARNTSFGPPPICVVRIGDFYHSKIAIRDINISYDDSPWDLNPEGIGVQPMIASVTLQVNFIGGQGLEKPVERLQNALSSNFFANTEMYDPRSVSTNSTIDGQDAKEFTKEFLNDLQRANQINDTPIGDNSDSVPEIKEGVYIGEEDKDKTTGQESEGDPTVLTVLPTGQTISYKKLITELETGYKSYFETFKTSYDDLLVEFGPQVHSLILSPTYRTVKDYEVNTSDVNTRTIEMLGEYSVTNELNNRINKLKSTMVGLIRSEDMSEMFKFDNFLSPEKIERSNTILRPKLEELVVEKLDNVITSNTLKGIVTKRNKVIEVLDKLNYLTKYVGDGQINEQTYTQATLSGFTFSSLYSEYDIFIDYFDKNSKKFTRDLDTSINFDTLNLNVTTLSEILSVLLYGKVTDIVDIYKDEILFTDNIMKRIEKKVEKFVDETKPEKIRLSRFKEMKGEQELKFTVSSTDEITDSQQKESLEKVHLDQVTSLGPTLNNYKPTKVKE